MYSHLICDSVSTCVAKVSLRKSDVLRRFNKPAKDASDMIMRFKVDRKSGVIVVVWDFGGQKVRHSRYVYSAQISTFHGDDDLVFY